VLFDGVAISGTKARVRWWAAIRVGAEARGRCRGMRCGRRRRRVWLGCAQDGGVVSMGDGVVTFKGGTITNTAATVSTGHDACWHVRFRWIRFCWKPLKAPGGYCRVRIPFRPSGCSSAAERGATRQRF
jgi:hypothetical protein